MAKRAFSTRDDARRLSFPSNDEVLTLGLRLGAAMRRREELDERSSDAKRAKKLSAEGYYDQAGEHSTDEIDSLRDMLTAVRAQSLTGAAVHAAEALSRVATLWDQFPDEHRTYALKREVRAIERLLYSVLAVVDYVADRKLADVVTPDYGSRYLDPWVPVEGRLKAIESDA